LTHANLTDAGSKRLPFSHTQGPVAQLVEHRTFNAVVAGSSPARLTIASCAVSAGYGFRSRRVIDVQQFGRKRSYADNPPMPQKSCTHADRHIKLDAQRCPMWIEGMLDSVCRRES
jgi:hypothetical protein